MVSIAEIEFRVRTLANELLTLERDDLYKPSLLVVGCSTSEIVGEKIGKAINPAVGTAVAQAIMDVAGALSVDVAFQCCEHLNRALVVERELVENPIKRNSQNNHLEIVSVVPQERAGGSAANAAYTLFENPALVEFIKADAGIDIGDTFIGMHLKHVAVPLRLSGRRVGEANVTFAATRPKYIGGERAKYSL